MATKQVRRTRAVAKTVTQELRDALPTQADIDRYDEDKAWLQTHKSEVLREHKDEWIAVHRQEVIAFSRNLDDLVKALRQRRVNMATVVIEYITDRQITMLL